MPFTSEKMHEFCRNYGISCTQQDIKSFDRLYEMLYEFNTHTNVTALKTEKDICLKHFIDSVYPLAFSLIPDNARVIDIGCGAGFPGLPLKMLKKDIDISFVDSTEKKLRFTKSVSDEFDLSAKVYPERAEELVAKGHREKYDICVSRAVANLSVLVELCMPYVKCEGLFIAYKSMKECNENNPDCELMKAKNAIKILGGRVEKVLSAPIVDVDQTVNEHALVVIKKEKSTPVIYPRRYAVILKKTL